jgi:hypothetical protein
MADILNDRCFEVCEKPTDLPFLSVQEGLCYRNCISKFSVFYPTLGRNLKHADFHYSRQKYLEEGLKKYPHLKPLSIDPWAKESEKLIEEFLAKKQGT